MSSLVAAANEKPTVHVDLADDDLEDGEIDDDDEEELPKQPVKSQIKDSTDNDVQFVGMEPPSGKAKIDDDIVYVGMLNHKTQTAGAGGGGGGGSNSNAVTAGGDQPGKKQKPHPLEDDHAVNIENAIANALKKKGIEPPMPKMLSASGDAEGNDASEGHQSSRSSRRRKRKKEREREREQKKDKDQLQKRARLASSETIGSEDMDEYEMMNVRGGSPPPSCAPTLPPRFPPEWVVESAAAGMGFDSGPDNYSSYDSYSDDETAAAHSHNQRQQRRQRREKETRSSRKRRDGDRRHDNNKRGNRDSGPNSSSGAGNNDDKPREPRKLELCKFYLMDCCAKRDKCSYMHKEFPCKYYYLGMECFAGEDCLFHHGEPLTDQLRVMLLKHMETAPKEILGDFKRISRDLAMTQLTRRHEQLCEKYDVKNTWPPVNPRNEQQQLHDQLVRQNLQLQSQLSQQQQPSSGSAPIPSLLDMVINPPPNILPETSNNADKKRKSRWTEKGGNTKQLPSAAISTPATKTTAISPAPVNADASAPAAAAMPATPAKVRPRCLDLENLVNVLSADHIAKLNKLGISNLEEMMEVPFGKLTDGGLSIIEIGELQRKAAAVANGETIKEESNSTASAVGTDKMEPEVIQVTTISSNSNSNSNGFVTVDYTQYLKDAHVNFDRNDLLDDDRDDEEQLVIDDGNDSADEEARTKKKSSEDDDPPKPSVFDLPTFMANMLKSSGNMDTPTASSTSAATIAEPVNSSSLNATPAESTPDTSKPAAREAIENNLAFTNTSVMNKLIFGDKHSDPEARAAFYRDIIRNPFKTNSGDADNDNSNSNTDLLYGQHDSRSLTPTPTASSSTPEPNSLSPKPLGSDIGAALTIGIAADATPVAFSSSSGLLASAAKKTSSYSRVTMYDYDEEKTTEQATRSAQNEADLNLRQQLSDSVGMGRDIDMRLPFEPMKHYKPATEIDAAIFSHRPIRWQLEEVVVEPTSYMELYYFAMRKDERDVRDPRLRRILGLFELPDSLMIEEAERKHSNSISSPDSANTSPLTRDLTPSSPPPSMCVPPPNMPGLPEHGSSPSGVRNDPRRDPRRAGNSYGTGAANANANAGGARQITEIRNMLQSSNWYKNLGSNNKIMVNQQLSQVFNELKNYHQQEPSIKNFDTTFIVTNRALQQIFGQLHMYINETGQVVQLLDDGPSTNSAAGGSSGLASPSGGNSSSSTSKLPIILPNLSHPPPNLLLHHPPPNIAGQLVLPMPPYSQPPPSTRPSLLGMAPVPNAAGLMLGQANNPFNPFVSGLVGGNLPATALNVGNLSGVAPFNASNGIFNKNFVSNNQNIGGGNTQSAGVGGGNSGVNPGSGTGSGLGNRHFSSGTGNRNSRNRSRNKN